MLGGIIDFFGELGDAISSLFGFVVSFVSDLVYVVIAAVHSIGQIPNAFGWMPEDFVAIILTIFGIVIVYKIAGREG